jgi:hypothetical protein
MQGQARSQGIARTDLQQRHPSMKGRELVQARVDIDSGVAAPRHNRPGEETVCVTEEETFDVIPTAAAASEAGA